MLFPINNETHCAQTPLNMDSQLFNSRSRSVHMNTAIGNAKNNFKEQARFSHTQNPVYPLNRQLSLFVVLKIIASVLATLCLPLVWPESIAICDLFLSIKLKPNVKKDVAIFCQSACNKQGFHELMKHLHVCKSSDTVHEQIISHCLTGVEKQKSFWCAYNVAAIYDTGCSICCLFLSEDSFRMCSLDLLTLLWDICVGLLGVIFEPKLLSWSSQGLLLFSLALRAGGYVDSHYPSAICCAKDKVLYMAVLQEW